MNTVKFNFRMLHKLQARLAEVEKRSVKVGLLASTATRVPTRGDRMTHNPSLGAVHEFGLAYTIRSTGATVAIPQRSFIQMPLAQHLDATVRKDDTDWISSLMTRGVARTLQKLGKLAEDTIQEAFNTKGWGQWPALQPSTVWSKKQNKTAILIETTQMRKAITSEVI